LGYQQFYQGLKHIHTPVSFIVNNDRKPLISYEDSQTGNGYVVKRRTEGAPPGFRVSKKKRKDINIKWIQF